MIILTFNNELEPDPQKHNPGIMYFEIFNGIHKLEPQGALIAHLNTKSTSVIS